MTTPRVTLVVVPRDYFSCTSRGLESIYEHTPQSDFELVYVDGGSPRRVRDYLRSQRDQHGFRLLRVDRYLSPNEARNIGLAQVRTELVVFLDNDVSVGPGWLDALVRCADETKAGLATPLTYEGPFEEGRIHFAGGSVSILEEREGREVTRHTQERMHLAQQDVNEVGDRLQRERCSLTEFHCVLARTEIFDRIGPFDEGMLNTREHLDFCLVLAEAGESIYFEPEATVAFIPPPPFELGDIPYYMLRWSDSWERRSLEHFRRKWNLAEDDFFKRRYARLGWRRKSALFAPIARALTFGRGSAKIENLIARADRPLNRALVARHERVLAKEAA